MRRTVGFTKIVALAVTLALSACGNSSSSDAISESGNTINSAVPDSAASGSDAMNDADAGELYLEIVNPVNCLYSEIINLQNMNSLGDGTVDPAALSGLQVLFSELSSERENAVRSFLGNSWPNNVANDIELLARDWSKVARAELALSEAVDQGAYTLGMDSLNAFANTAEANPGYIRSALGIGPAAETDRC
jgi:hypothetical protein